MHDVLDLVLQRVRSDRVEDSYISYQALIASVLVKRRELSEGMEVGVTQDDDLTTYLGHGSLTGSPSAHGCTLAFRCWDRCALAW